jgi:hypothetical protein
VALTTYIILDRVEAIDASMNSVEMPPVKGTPKEEDFIEVAAPTTFEAFRKIGAVNAHSTDQALRKAAEQHGDGYYVAVSERHWKSEEFETETVTRVRAKSS